MKKQQQTIFIWDKSAYCHTDKGWIRAHLTKPDDTATFVQENCKAGSSVAMIYDPEHMQTDFAECPGGVRMIVREAMQASHEMISNMQTGWGYQTPWPIAGSGGAHGTFCSCEAQPQLYALSTSLLDIDRKISRAYPMITLASYAAGAPGRTNIFLAIDQDSKAFVYISTNTGMRACRKINAANRKEEFDVWAEISLVLGEYGITFEDGSQRPIVKVYQAPGTNIKTQCPYWEGLEQQAQVEVSDFSGLALILGNIPSKHTSSLMDDMPKIISFDFGLKIAAAVLCVALIAAGIYGYLQLSRERSENRQLQTKRDSLAAQLVRLNKNKTEIETLKKLYAQSAFEQSRGRLKLITSLPAVIPREATLLSASIGTSGDTGFRINGIFWNHVVNEKRQGGTKQTTTTTAAKGKDAATTVTPISPIVKQLESSIQSLLVTASQTSFNNTTGDFVIAGTTPMGESAVAARAAEAAAAQKPGAKPAARPAPTTNKKTR